MQKSDSIKELATALAKFQGEVQDPAKNSDNPFFKSKYVELDDLLKAIRPITAKYGLSVIQWPSAEGLHTLITHNSGEWLEVEPLPLNPTKNDPQGMGSAITYARRYSLSAVLGVAWDADDDGNGASEKDKKQPTTTSADDLPADPGEYPINFKNYKGPLKDADRNTIEWIANTYAGRDEGAKQAAKAYLNNLNADNEFNTAINQSLGKNPA